jgi:starvation-inducible DNA-binding protein
MINIGLEDSNRREVTQVLNNLVSDEYLLSTKTKNYHWNVTGPHFHVLHGLFGDQYTKLDQLIDRIGERIRALGAHAFGTMTEFPRCTRLQERPGMPTELAMVEDLYDDHEVLLRSLRGVLAGNASLRFDFGTTDFLTGAMQEHEKMAWMLRSVLGKQAHLKKWLEVQEAIQRESGIEKCRSRLVADGQRFAVLTGDRSKITTITLLTNWPAELKK